MKEETTPTAGLQVEDIKRVTPLIRALYLNQEVWFDQDDLDKRIKSISAYCVHFGNGHAFLRSISSITDDEIILLQFRAFREGFEFVERKHYEEKKFFILEIKTPSEYQGKPTSYNELISFHYSRLSIKEYQWLIQHSFAIDYYDSATNTTITVEQQVAAGIIKLKS